VIRGEIISFVPRRLCEKTILIMWDYDFSKCPGKCDLRGTDCCSGGTNMDLKEFMEKLVIQEEAHAQKARSL